LVTWLAEHGAEPMRMEQPEFVAFVEKERDRAASMARAAGIARP
jgi:tripartite-type tricarboxylate transporter receptor subunit TctC